MTVRKSLRILLSAYACEPGKGSEPGVGWNWAVELSRLGHKVFVLTRENNRALIDAAVAADARLADISFHYFDLPHRWRRWKKGGRGVHLYYLLWQWGASSEAKRLHAEHHFDRVHHVTFVSVRQPSFMWRLGIPFVFGPVAGGESAPLSLRRHFGWKAWALDAIRDIANQFVRVDPLVRITLRNAQRILVTSEQTRSLLPKYLQSRTQVSLAIGISDEELTRFSVSAARSLPAGPLRILFVGRFVELKGMALGVKAFAQYVRKHPGSTLTMVGQGPADKLWLDLARREGIEQAIQWVDWLPQDRLPEMYAQHDVFLFPSLHDSGGMVVLEAMSAGLPVIALDIGGPSQMVDASCGGKVSVAATDEQQVIEQMATKLAELSANPMLWLQLSRGAVERAQAFRWQRLAVENYLAAEGASR